MKQKLLFLAIILFVCISSFGQTVANQPPNISKCQDGELYPSFDLTQQTAFILGDQDPQQYIVNYFYWPENAMANYGPISNPTAVGGAVIPDTTTYYARVTNTSDNTFAITSFTVQIIGVAMLEQGIVYCDSRPLSPPNIGNYYTGPNQTGEMIDLSESEYIVNESGTVLYVHAEVGNCVIDVPVTIEFGTSPEINEPTPLYVCDENGDGIFVADLTTKIAEITNDNQNLYVTLHETEYLALMGIAPIPNSSLYMSPVTPPYTVYANVTSIVTGCSSVTSFVVDAGDCTENFFSGTLTYDISDNGCIEGSIPASNRNVSYTHNGVVYNTFTNEEGNYSFSNVPTGNSTVIAQSGIFNASPGAIQLTMPGLQENVNFCLSADNPVTDVAVMFCTTNSARPGQEVSYYLSYRNLNSDVVSGEVSLLFDNEKLDFISSTVPMTVSGNMLSLTYENLAPFSNHWVVIKFAVMTPPVVNLGNILHFTATITTSGNDVYLGNNNSFLNQVVVDSMDPNDIAVREGESITEEQADDFLHYIIRFQNKGTADAINIRVTGLLDSNLDWSTFEPITSSHNYQVNRKNNQIEFLYKDINLAFENGDTGIVPESNGYTIYRVKPKASVTIGDSMSAQGAIYFDFNEPIITNTVTTTVQNITGIDEKSLEGFTLYPNPTSSQVNLMVLNAENGFDVTVIDMLGKTVIKNSFLTNEADINISALNSGIYFISITADGKQSTKKLIVK